MKWEQDLIRDIRTGTDFDNQEQQYTSRRPMLEEVTDANRAALKERFLKIRDNCKAILEIGVCRNGGDSFTHVFLNNKLDETVYIGIDLEDKSFLNNPDKNIWTIQGNSSSITEAMKIFKDLGVTEFGCIFIDGWHSINQCLDDWEYTTMLGENGVVAFHDVSYHPGPLHFIQALDRDTWDVEENVCPLDFGLGFAWKK